MKERKHSGNATSVTSTHTKKDISTGRLAPVMIGCKNGFGTEGSRKGILNLRPRKRKINAEIPYFFGGIDLYDGPLGPPIEEEEDEDE